MKREKRPHNGMHPSAEAAVAARAKTPRSEYVRTPRGMDPRDNPNRPWATKRRKAASATD